MLFWNFKNEDDVLDDSDKIEEEEEEVKDEQAVEDAYENSKTDGKLEELN